jgi:tungstate transport system permease protein
MGEFSAAFGAAAEMVFSGDADLLEIVMLSLRVSLSAVLCATAIALPVGALIALGRFPGRGAVIALLNSLMGLPPVVVGLVVYLLLSRAGPLGEAGLLFTPSAMIIAQTVLVTPLITALARQTIADLAEEYGDMPFALGASRVSWLATLIWEGRFRLITSVLAGFGRAIAEVGAVMIVGGNINHHTRVMTTAIALETAKGALPLALGLGVILLALTITVNALAVGIGAWAQRRYGA